MGTVLQGRPRTVIATPEDTITVMSAQRNADNWKRLLHCPYRAVIVGSSYKTGPVVPIGPLCLSSNDQLSCALNMKRHSRWKWEGEIVNRQRNTVFPDTVGNDRLLIVLAWKGSPHATRAQRLGIALLSILPLGVAATLICGGWRGVPRNSIFVILYAVLAFPFAAFGIRMLRNALLPSPSKSDHEHYKTDHNEHSAS